MLKIYKCDAMGKDCKRHNHTMYDVNVADAKQAFRLEYAQGYLRIMAYNKECFATAP